MSYTITAARYATEDKTGVVIDTVESGAVAVSKQDRPELWAKLQAWVAAGGVIAPYAETPGEVTGAPAPGTDGEGPDVLA